jgi:hypothetical protein
VKLKELRLKKNTDDKDELNDVALKKHLPRIGTEKRQVDQTSPIWSTMHAKKESFGVGIRPFCSSLSQIINCIIVDFWYLAPG